jgi:hypothetical protein
MQKYLVTLFLLVYSTRTYRSKMCGNSRYSAQLPLCRKPRTDCSPSFHDNSLSPNNLPAIQVRLCWKLSRLFTYCQHCTVYVHVWQDAKVLAWTRSGLSTEDVVNFRPKCRPCPEHRVNKMSSFFSLFSAPTFLNIFFKLRVDVQYVKNSNNTVFYGKIHQQYLLR